MLTRDAKLFIPHVVCSCSHTVSYTLRRETRFLESASEIFWDWGPHVASAGGGGACGCLPACMPPSSLGVGRGRSVAENAAPAHTLDIHISKAIPGREFLPPYNGLKQKW